MFENTVGMFDLRKVLAVLPSPSENMTISPGSTSRRNSAPIRSNAQVSEAMTGDPSSHPKHKGRKPRGSRTAIILSGGRIRVSKPRLLDSGTLESLLQWCSLRPCYEMKNDLAVAGRLEDRTIIFQLPPDLFGIHQVAIMTESQFSFAASNLNRLRIGNGTVQQSNI